MKQLKALGILAAVAAVIVLGAVLITNQLTQKEKLASADSTPVTLLSFDSTKIASVNIQNSDGEFNFIYADKAWSLTNQSFEINTYTISAICNYLCQLSSVKTITHAHDNLSAYGLDTPVTLLCTLSDGQSYTLMVGNATPGNDGYYAMLPDNDNVYIIDYTSGSLFSVTQDMLKNAYLFDTYTSEITTFSLQRGDDVIYDLSYDTANGGWKMQQPLAFEGYTAKVNDMLDSFTRVTVSAFLREDAADLSKFGLDQPYCIIKAATAEKSTTILVGKAISNSENENSYYGMFEETKQVFIFTRADISFIDDETVDKIYPYIYSADISAVSKVVVDCNEVQATMELDYDNQVYKVNGITIDPANEDAVALYQNFYRGVATLGISDVDIAAKPSGDAEISITYTLESGDTVKLELIPAEDATFWVMRNGTYTGLMTRKKFITRSGSITGTYALLQEYLDTLH